MESEPIKCEDMNICNDEFVRLCVVAVVMAFKTTISRTTKIPNHTTKSTSSSPLPFAMSSSNASPSYTEYMSAYDQATSDHDWLAELSEEWISNSGSAEPSEQGSARGMSVRSLSAFPSSAGKIDTIPEEGTEE